eukprot:SAG31_NODE_1052_length_10154_cov_2.814818_9_plen_76_part_00
MHTDRWQILLCGGNGKTIVPEDSTGANDECSLQRELRRLILTVFKSTSVHNSYRNMMDRDNNLVVRGFKNLYLWD